MQRSVLHLHKRKEIMESSDLSLPWQNSNKISLLRRKVVTGPLHVAATASGEGTVLGDILDIMLNPEQTYA